MIYWGGTPERCDKMALTLPDRERLPSPRSRHAPRAVQRSRHTPRAVTFRPNFFALLAILLLTAAAAVAGDERTFQEARWQGAELKYIGDVPVLTVAGTPEEIGRQKAALTADAVRKLADYPRQLLERSSRKERLAKYQEVSKALGPNIPADHRAEMRAFAEQSGVDRDLGVLANTMVDIYRGSFGCSSLIVSANASTTGGPLFGRNLDFYTLGMLDKYSLVTVHRPKGKHAFASIGFPGLFGCLSGMNDAGLALAVHEVFLSRDGAAMFNPKGVPYMFCFRRVLEECTTVEEAEKMLRGTERTTILSLALCDRKGGVVLEMTPDNLVDRHGSEGILACTNHFRSDELAVLPFCSRYRKLILARKMEELGVADVAKKLDEVNLGRLTVQTMIFEPATLKLHLAIGSCPSSALPLRPVDLKPLFGNN
jgi:isopenicillin-N N-acyltransferase like protein